jgi:hypothetical protein
MSEKEKSKANPFAAYLRPTENLLWQSPERVKTTESLLPQFNVYTLGVIGLFIMLIVIIASVAQDAKDMLSSPSAVVSALAIIIGLVGYWVRFSLRGAAKGETLGPTYDDHAHYAITSERLFYERGYDLQAESLDNITLINVLSNNTLSFGAVFPMWSGLEDAAYVKTMIEQAQKDRLKEQST